MRSVCRDGLHQTPEETPRTLFDYAGYLQAGDQGQHLAYGALAAGSQLVRVDRRLAKHTGECALLLRQRER
jgi:hypothetical protein